MPALLKAVSTLPQASCAVAYIRRTSSSTDTSARTNRPPAFSAADFPAASSTSTATILAPSAASRMAVARPIPLPAPVITATRSASPRMCSVLRRDEQVLGLGEGIQGVRAELAAEPGLLEPAERRPVAHRGVRVDRQVARLHGPRDAHRAAHVLGPDRAGQPVRRV